MPVEFTDPVLVPVFTPESVSMANVTGLAGALAPFTAHLADTANPHATTKAQVGLSAVANTAPADLPVSTAQAAADTAAIAAAAADATAKADAAQAAAVQRANHTGAQAQSTITGLADALAPFTAHLADTANPHATTKAQVGLSAVDNIADVSKPVSTAQATAITVAQTAAATDATTKANAAQAAAATDATTKAAAAQAAAIVAAATDATAKADAAQAFAIQRANHTGEQAQSTITGLAAALAAAGGGTVLSRSTALGAPIEADILTISGTVTPSLDGAAVKNSGQNSYRRAGDANNCVAWSIGGTSRWVLAENASAPAGQYWVGPDAGVAITVPVGDPSTVEWTAVSAADGDPSIELQAATVATYLFQPCIVGDDGGPKAVHVCIQLPSTWQKLADSSDVPHL